MIVYLGSPGNQHHAHACKGMPVLISYGAWWPGLANYVKSFDGYIVDSGAFSEFNSGKRIEQDKYLVWAAQWRPTANAIASLDDIRGDWRSGLSRWLEAKDWTFPTFHETDPPEALEAILSHDPKMIGLGGLPPRRNETKAWLERTWPRIPGGLPVHGWAMRRHLKEWPWASVDSVNWILDARKILAAFPWLTPAESCDIIVKRYKRAKFAPEDSWTSPILDKHSSTQLNMPLNDSDK